LNELGQEVGRAASQISTIENGKRETSVTLLATIAKALRTDVADLIDPTPIDDRQALELEAERNQASPMYSSLGLPQVRIKSLPSDALEAIVGLQRQLGEVLERRAATPEEARRANRELRDRMREKNNYFAELESTAAELLDLVGYESGTVSQRQTALIAEKLGFSLHYVSDLPESTRSISDTANKRLYLPNADAAFDPRSHLLMSLAPHVLGYDSPKDFHEFLQQRVEANYLAAAILLPESTAVPLLEEEQRKRVLSLADARAGPMLQEEKRKRVLSVAHLRDMFGVGYEIAAHRFTNLATEHLGLPVHFMKVHNSGTIHKAYSNDGLPFPTDPLGAIEGQFACKRFTSRTVFRVADRFSPYYQYTDTPQGSFWCTARVLPGGDFAISVGVPFAHVRWFEGR